MGPVRKGQDPPIQFGQVRSLAGVFGGHFWEKETTVTLSMIDAKNLGWRQSKSDSPSSNESRAKRHTIGPETWPISQRQIMMIQT